MSLPTPSLRLKKLRDFLGYSQREMAEDFQVTSGAIAHWESGFRPVPGPILKLLEVYEEALSLTPSNRSPSPEALEASRVLFRQLVTTLEKEGIRFNEDSRSHMQRSLDSFVTDIFPVPKLSAKIKLKVIGQFLKSFEGSMGLSIKAAQLASFLELGLATEISSFLAYIQSSGAPLPFAKIQEILAQELEPSLLESFKRIQPKPLAVTSLAQIHLAELHTGERVVIKVKHPRIEAILNGQMKKISFLARLGEIFGKKIDSLCEDIQTQVMHELDYEREVFNQERFRNIFEHEPRIVIPKIYRHLSTKKIIVSQYEEGLSFETFCLRGNSQQKSEAGLLIAYFHSVAIFRHLLMHADAHPANFLFRNNQVVFLDFGRVIEYEPEEIAEERRFCLKIFYRQKQEVLEDLYKSNLISAADNFNFDEFWDILQQKEAHHLTDSFQITKSHLKALNDAMGNFQDRKKIRVNKRMFRAILVNATLLSLFANLEAKGSWRKQSLRILEAEDKTPLFQTT